MFKYILASAFNFYKPFRREDPYFDAVIIVGLCQEMLSFLAVILIRRFTKLDLLQGLNSKVVLCVILACWMGILFRIYSKNRIDTIVAEFDILKTFHRRLWGIATLVCLILPVVIIAIMLSK